jgi:hypothetical protein
MVTLEIAGLIVLGGVAVVCLWKLAGEHRQAQQALARARRGGSMSACPTRESVSRG